MSDRVFYPAVAAMALLMILLALVWPQGQGARSPGPFGRAETEPPYMAFERKRAADAARKAELEAIAEEAARTGQVPAAAAPADKAGLR